MTEIFADANLFLRYLTNDVPEQADAVEELLDQAEANRISLVTNSHTIAEIVWVLTIFYGISKVEVQMQIIGVLRTPGLRVAEDGLVLQALQWFVEKNVDYIDAYQAAWMQERGLDTIATFDKKHFARFDHLKVMTPGQTTR